MNPIDKAFPEFQRLSNFQEENHDWGRHRQYKFDPATLISEFTQLKSLCAEMDEALKKAYEYMVADSPDYDILPDIKNKLTKFQSVFKGE